MFRKYLVLASLFCFFFSSCEQEDVLNSYSDTVQISTQIQSHDLNTRADVGTNGIGNFTENDQISLRITPLNGVDTYHDQTLKNQIWTPSLSWKELGEEASFAAFFPKKQIDYQEEFTHVVELDQSSGKNFEKSDLMYATAPNVKKGERVDLSFSHLMSCFTVKLKGTAYSEEELSSAVIIVKAYHKIQIKKDGKLGELHDYNSKHHKEDNAAEIKLKHKEGATFQAIICPQTVNNLSWGSDWLKIRIKQKEYQLPIPKILNDGTTFKSFEPGKNVTLSLALEGKDVEFINQTRWVYGIKDMPAVEDWKYYDVLNNFKGLTWDSKYGWYDCNKVSTEKPGDKNMCWAASCSNILHWWLDHNQTYLDKYNYKGPRNYNNHLESEVFQVFKDNFIDEGNFEKNGLSWFFFGDPIDNNKLTNANSGGYFKDVFNQSLFKTIGIPNYKSFNKEIKKALKNKQAIAFSILIDGFGGGSAHALTIWGAEFNELGHVCAIYYVDNNDKSAAEQAMEGNQVPAGMLVSKVGEYAGKNSKYNGYVAMEGSTHQLSVPINTITLLNLGQDQWESYFNR